MVAINGRFSIRLLYLKFRFASMFIGQHFWFIISNHADQFLGAMLSFSSVSFFLFGIMDTLLNSLSGVWVSYTDAIPNSSSEVNFRFFWRANNTRIFGMSSH